MITKHHQRKVHCIMSDNIHKINLCREAMKRLEELDKMCPYLDDDGNPVQRQPYIAAIKIAKMALEAEIEKYAQSPSWIK